MMSLNERRQNNFKYFLIAQGIFYKYPSVNVSLMFSGSPVLN
jgi:hypothetical protein